MLSIRLTASGATRIEARSNWLFAVDGSPTKSTLIPPRRRDPLTRLFSVPPTWNQCFLESDYRVHWNNASGSTSCRIRARFIDSWPHIEGAKPAPSAWSMRPNPDDTASEVSWIERSSSSCLAWKVRSDFLGVQPVILQFFWYLLNLSDLKMPQYCHDHGK